MLKAKCPKCRARYYSWALYYSKYQYCPTCNEPTEVISSYRKSSKAAKPTVTNVPEYR